MPAASDSEATAEEANLPLRPVGSLRNIALGHAVFTRNAGAVFGIDEEGTLWAYPGGPGGRLGKPVVVGTGFGGQTLQPVMSGYPFSISSTYSFWGFGCDGRLFQHIQGYSEGSPPAEQIGNGWTGFRATMAGDVAGHAGGDLLAIKEPGGDLYLYRGSGPNYQFFWPYPKVGNGWQDFELLPAGDVNGDRRNDIYGIDSAGDLYLYRGLGEGRFATKVKVGNGWTGFDIASGMDLDGDDKADLIGRDDQGRLFFYRGLGNGRFATKVQVGNGWGPLDPGPDCSVTEIGQMVSLPWAAPHSRWIAL
jgi:hypothetical protein